MLLWVIVPVGCARPARVASGPLTCLQPCLLAGGTWAACVGVGGRMLVVLSSPTSSAWLSAVLGDGHGGARAERGCGELTVQLVLLPDR